MNMMDSHAREDRKNNSLAIITPGQFLDVDDQMAVKAAIQKFCLKLQKTLAEQKQDNIKNVPTAIFS